MAVLSPAKVNLWLRVVGVRSDGMHELDTGFAFVDFGDAMRFCASDAICVHCTLEELEGARNLVHRVLQAFAEEAGVRAGLDVFIEKRIPLQAGLGGGSSNAATALLVANAFWGVHWPRERLIEWSAAFGADIPCFLYGRAARGQGIGERLRPIACPSGWLCMAMPASEDGSEAGLATAKVFACFDQLCRAGDLALNAAPAIDSLPPLGENALEPAARVLLPSLGRLLDAMRSRAAKAWMTGSGACCVSLHAKREDAERMAAWLQGQRLTRWIAIGRLQVRHPLSDWGVAKR